MTDLDSTEIISSDESFSETSSTNITKTSLRILSGTTPNTFEINKETIIGRTNPSDIIIAAPSLSKQHAKITINNGQYFITDLGSSNKTFHNKVQLQPNVCYALHNGDEIKFGDIICAFQEDKQTETLMEKKVVDINPSTQTITDSSNDLEPIQPIKVWSKNNNEGNDSIDVIPKQNGINELQNKSSSSFVLQGSSIAINDNDNNKNLIIGSTILPDTSPLIVETKESNNDEQREINPSPQTEKNISNEETKLSEMDDISPLIIETKTIEILPIDSSTSENVQLTEMEASAPVQQIETNDEQMDHLSPKLNVKINEELENITDEIIQLKEQIQDSTKQDLIKETTIDDQMDTDQTTESPSMVIDDKQQENLNEMEDEFQSNINTDLMNIDETEKSNIDITTNSMEEEAPVDISKTSIDSPMEPEKKTEESTPAVKTEELPSVTEGVEENEEVKEEVEENEEAKEIEEPTLGTTRGVPRKNVPRARSRRAAATTRGRVVSTRLHGTRRNPILPIHIETEQNNTTLEETVNTETEESPKKPSLTPEVKTKTPRKTATVTPTEEPNQTNTSNIRVSARIKERASSGRTRQYPYTDDYVDLDDLEKHSKANTAAAVAVAVATPTKKTRTTEAAKPTPTPPSPATATTITTVTATATPGRKSGRGRASATSQKRISLRQQPIDASKSLEQNDTANIYEQIDAVTDTKETPTKNVGRKRKSTTPTVAPVATKRSRHTTPQTVPTTRTRRQQATTVEVSPTVAKSSRRTTGGQQQAIKAILPAIVTPTTVTTTTPTSKRGRKSTKLVPTIEQSLEKQSSTNDRPVRIALSSHLNFDQNHIDALRKLGFEIMDESCHVDALVVDRIRRTKKFFMCLARGALILSPSWIEIMIKENHYIPYDKFYLEDKNAETRYGFQLRESIRLAKQGLIFADRKFYCTQNTSPPYDDLKDIIEAAGGKLIEKINMNKPGKDIICIVAQTHKQEFEDLFKKGISIVSEEFILSGISKQKLDFNAFSLFQSSTAVKSK